MTPNKWIMRLYKDDELIHSYIDALFVLENMCRVLIDLTKDGFDHLTIYRNNKMVLSTRLNPNEYYV